MNLVRGGRSLLRNPLDRFLLKLLWFESKGLPEHLRVTEIKEVMQVLDKIRRRGKDEARFDFIMLDILCQLDDIEKRFYVARPDMR